MFRQRTMRRAAPSPVTGAHRRVNLAAAKSLPKKRENTVLDHLDIPWAALQSKFPQIPRAPDLPEPTPPTMLRDADARNVGVDSLLSFWAAELRIGDQSLRKWRNFIADANVDASKMLSSETSNDVLRQHQRLLVACAQRLRCVVSPFVGLAHAENGSDGTVLVAKRDIPPGMFLLSLPQSAAIVADPPQLPQDVVSNVMAAIGAGEAAADTVKTALHYFVTADDLVAQVLDASDDPSDLHHSYAALLRQTASPPMNLCFIETRSDADRLLKSDSGRLLWQLFHAVLGRRPLCPSLENVPTDAYCWALSHVISRRMSSSLMLPLFDKLNHPATSGMPNCYYTLAEEGTFCGLDVVDNLFAGVEAAGIYEPHAHLFSIDKIPKGAQLTISYSDADPLDGGDGFDTWALNYGVVPKVRPRLSETDLKSLASVIAERRIGTRQQLFPPAADARTEQGSFH